MKFESVENPESINFILPQDHINIARVLNKVMNDRVAKLRCCAKWRRA